MTTYVADGLNINYKSLINEKRTIDIQAVPYNPNKRYVVNIPDDNRVHLVVPSNYIPMATEAINNGYLRIEGSPSLSGLEVAIHGAMRFPTNAKYHCMK